MFPSRMSINTMSTIYSSLSNFVFDTTYNLTSIPHTHKLYIVNGHYGIGKTSIIHSILQDFIITEWTDDIQIPQKNLYDSIISYSKNNNIQAIFEKRSEVLILENLPVLATESTVRNFIEEIHKIRKTVALKPIIAIVHNNIENLKFPDWVAFVYFHPPSSKKIHEYIDKLIGRELKLDVRAKNELWRRSDKSFRKLRELIVVLPSLINKYRASYDDIQSILDLSISKDLGQDIYKSTQIMMRYYNYAPTNICKSITDQSMLAMMLHENAIDDIILKTGTTPTKINTYRKILNLYRYTDHLDNYIFNKQHWELHDVCFKVKAIHVSYLLNSIPTLRHKQDISFTSLLSKSSIQFTNFRYIVNLRIRLGVPRQKFIPTCLNILRNPGHYRHVIDRTDIEKIAKLVTSAEFNPFTLDRKEIKQMMAAAPADKKPENKKPANRKKCTDQPARPKRESARKSSTSTTTSPDTPSA